MAPPTARQPSFDGFASPSFTQVPDELFDVLMPTLSECELRVLLYIIRRTFGFKRDSDAISLTQLVDGITTSDGRRLDFGAGVARSSAVRVIKSLQAKGVIVATRRNSVERGNETTTYALRFKQHADQGSDPQFHHETRGAGSMVKPALVSPRNPQDTEARNTDFEYSKGETLGDKTEEEGSKRHPSLPQPDHTGSPDDGRPLAALLARRTRRVPAGEDDQAIIATVDRFAGELGDRASRKATVTRALNLFRAAGVGRDAFVDALYRARGEVRDRRQHPGKAPLPKNQMAYFFAVVEDLLGLRGEASVNGQQTPGFAAPSGP